MKDRLLSHESAVRHLIMLGLTILAFVWGYLFFSFVAGWEWFAKNLQDILSGDEKKLLFSFFGLLIGAAAILGVALYWYIKKLAWKHLKSFFFAFFGWLPFVRKHDAIFRQEEEEKKQRKAQRDWDRKNPQIAIEERQETDEEGNTVTVQEEVIQNPVEPVKEETKAFFLNVLRRLGLGLVSLFLSVIIPLAAPLVAAILVLFLISQLIPANTALGIAIALLVLSSLLFILQPILALALNAPAKEAP